MTITQLRYFMIAAQMENLSGAAEALYITQSSLSKKIASLEKELGVPLFDRKGKSVRLNAAGEHFLAGCRKILGELDEVLEEIQQYSETGDTRIRIGAEGEPGPLLAWMADFRAAHPEVSYEIDSSLGSREYPDINEYDVMIYPSGHRYDKFKGYPFYTETFFLAVQENDPLVQKGPVSNRDLNGRDLVFLREGEDRYEYPCQVCRALIIKPGREHFTDSELLKRRLISEGIAAGFVSSEMAELYQGDRQIRLLPLISSRFSRQMMICFKRKKHLSGLAAEFCEYVSGRCSLTET